MEFNGLFSGFLSIKKAPWNRLTNSDPYSTTVDETYNPYSTLGTVEFHALASVKGLFHAPYSTLLIGMKLTAFETPKNAKTEKNRLSLRRFIERLSRKGRVLCERP